MIYSKRGYEIPFDSVFTSAWKADGGKTGQFLINYHDRETACTVELPEGEYLLYKSTVEKKTVRGGNHTVKIAPLSAVLIEEV